MVVPFVETDPDAQCKDHTVELDENGQGSFTELDIDNGSNDECTNAIDLTLEVKGPTSYGCSDVGTESATLCVTDER